MSRALLFTALLAASLLVGCSKKAVFKPDRIESHLSYSDRTPAPMLWALSGGATLADGSMLLKSGEHEALKLPEGYKLVGINGPWRLAADNSGNLLIIDAQNNTRQSLNYSQPILAASTDGLVVATVSQDNSHRIRNLSDGQSKLLVRERPSIAINTRIAAPLIGVDQVIFATLDGKLLIADRNRGEVILERVVGTESYFGNVLFLYAYENRIIAATASRVISLALDGSAESLDIAVRYLGLLPSGLFLFSTEGRMLHLSATLGIQNESRLSFARMIDAHERDGYLYAVERSGYLIKMRSDFSQMSIHSLPDTLAAPLLATPDRLYHHRKGIVWP